ncbi:restriction endonuclease [bacterium]|nr:restriction endonuclease [bacterium]
MAEHVKSIEEIIDLEREKIEFFLNGIEERWLSDYSYFIDGDEIDELSDMWGDYEHLKVHDDGVFTRKGARKYLGLNESEEIKVCVELVRDSLSNDSLHELKDNILNLTEILSRNNLLDEEAKEDLFDQADILTKVNIAHGVDLLYAQEEKHIIVPKLIIDVSNEFNNKLIHMINRDPELLFNLSSYQFEEIVAEIFDAFGYKVELTSSTRDGGYDIIAIGTPKDVMLKFLIECKRYRKEHKVEISHVRSLYGIKLHTKVSKALLVTTSTFTEPARKFEKEHIWELELKDYNDVIKWISLYSKIRINYK